MSVSGGLQSTVPAWNSERQKEVIWCNEAALASVKAICVWRTTSFWLDIVHATRHNDAERPRTRLDES